jgi:exodeoxyribonuclease-3
MKIASWNVNSIRQRLGHVKDWLAAEQPDVLALQEIKVVTEGFPAAEFEALGYHCAVDGQKAYNGVALLSRLPPAEVACGLPNFEDEQKRVLAASFADLRLFNLYVPNGQSVGSEKFEYKLRWLTALRDHLREELGRHGKIALLGDFNIAPEDRDVHDPAEWRDQVLCSVPGTREAAGIVRPRFRRCLPLFRAAAAGIQLVGLPCRGIPPQPRPAHRPDPRLPGAGRHQHRQRHRHRPAGPRATLGPHAGLGGFRLSDRSNPSVPTLFRRCAGTGSGARIPA